MRKWLLVVLLLVAGCSKSARGPAFAKSPAPNGKATVYLYRPSAMSGGARGIFMSVPIEANNCFEMLNGGYLTYVANPGILHIGASGSGEVKQFSVKVAPGEEKFVRVAWGTWGAAELEEVSPAEGAAEIAETRAIGACGS
jgi:hypothetical protein